MVAWITTRTASKAAETVSNAGSWRAIISPNLSTPFTATRMRPVWRLKPNDSLLTHHGPLAAAVRNCGEEIDEAAGGDSSDILVRWIAGGSLVTHRGDRPLQARCAPPVYHPGRWRSDGKMTASNVQELRPKGADSEKITINLGYVDIR